MIQYESCNMWIEIVEWIQNKYDQKKISSLCFECFECFQMMREGLKIRIDDNIHDYLVDHQVNYLHALR